MPDIRLGEHVDAIPQYKPLHITATGTLIPVGLCVNTTTATTITAGPAVVVTPASMANITKGKRLSVVNAGVWENITVTSVTSTTFTAPFQNSYSGTTNIYSVDGSVLGPIIVGNPGLTSPTLTLYNGLPGMLPKAGAIIAVIPLVAGTLGFAGICDLGLFYTYAAGTPGDLTLHYLDHVPQF